MLFDLEDYKSAGIIGVARKSVGNVYWGDSYTTWRATHDAYRKAVNEWFLASDVMASVEDKHQLMVNYININDKFSDSFRKGKIFFSALCSKSIPAEIVAANGITEGTTLRIFYVHQSENWYNEFIDLPNLEYAWGNDWKYVLFIGEDSPNGYSELQWRGESFVYTTMTQAIYDAHKNAIVDLQAKIKETYIIAEGISDIPEWIAPAIPLWSESAELSGYVRDSRSLPISGATVRLVDADGINHDLVTNDLGYYHFTKEYIYNNISLGTASSAEFNMFVLEETISGTILYSQTNIFQNSFFGAVNDRGLSWPVLVKAGKPNRRNFKIEVVTDYSDYASISGTILDQDGNPVQNALVELKYYDEYGVNNGQYLNGQNFDGMYMPLLSLWSSTINIGDTYKNGVWSHTTKYTLFGEEKSLLTDENGHYEYSSQMVGEWVNNHLFKALQDQGFDMSETSIYRKILKHNANKVEKGMAPDKVVDGALGRIHMSNDTSASTTTRVQFLQNGKILVSFIVYDSSNADNVCYNGVSLNVPGKNNTYGNKIYSGILKLNADYTLDETFSISNLMPDVETTGKEIFEVNTMTELSDGKILVTGTSVGNRIHENVFYVLNSDGTIYANVSTNLGLDLLNNYQDSNGNYYFRDNDWGVLTGILQSKVLSDGRILAVIKELKDYGTEGYGSPVGFWNFGSTYALRILNQDGTIDTDGIDILLKSYQNIYGESFGGGIYPAEQIEELKMVVLGDSIYLSGKCQFETSSGYSSLGVVKIGMDGVVDESFRFEMTKNPEDSGEVRFLSDAVWVTFNSGDVLADGSIVVNTMERWSNGTPHDSYLRKHNSDGSITIQPVALNVDPATEWDTMVPLLMNLTTSGDIIHKFENIQINKDNYWVVDEYGNWHFPGTPDGIADVDNVWGANVHLINTAEGPKIVLISGNFLHTIDLTTMTLDNRYYMTLMNNGYWWNLEDPTTTFSSFVFNNSLYLRDFNQQVSIRYIKEDQYGSVNLWNSTDLGAGRYLEMNRLFVKLDYAHFNIFDNVYRSQSEEFTNPLNLNEKSYKTYTVNTLMVWLNPWIQDPVSGNVYNYYHKRNSLGTEPQKIYAYDNWFNSRFPYSFNTRPDGDFERYSVEAYGGEELTLNIQETLTIEESGAERLRLKLIKNFDGYGSGYWDFQSITFKSTTGYVRVKGSFGERIIGDGTTGIAYDENYTSDFGPGEGEGGYIYFNLTNDVWNSATPNLDGTYDVYFYSCEPTHGAASGYITYVNPYHTMLTEIDLSEMVHLEYLRFASRLILQNPTPEENTFPLDVSTCVGLKALSLEEYWSFKLNIVGLNQLTNLEFLKVEGEVYTSKVSISGEFHYETDMSQVRRGLGSPCDRTGISDATDVIKLSDGKYIVSAAPYGAYESDVYGHAISLPTMRGIMKVNPDDLSFDTSFNDYYKSLTDGQERGFNGWVFGLDKQSNDKIIAVGDFNQYNQQNIKKGIARLNPNGSYDSSFILPSSLEIYGGLAAVKVLPDDKILIMGWDLLYNGTYYGLLRLNSNGSIDSSFNLSSVSNIQTTRRISIQSSGKILIQSNNYIKRLNTNGTIDTSFTEIYTGGRANSISVLSDDTFIVAGSEIHIYQTISGQIVSCAFAKYGVDGILDHTFTKKAAKYRFWNIGRAIILSDDTIVLTENFDKYKFNDIDVDSQDELVIDTNYNDDYINDIKLVMDADGNVKTDYLPITTGWPTSVTLQNIIEDEDNLIMLTSRQMAIRTTGGQSEETYIQGLGKFIKRPKTKYRFDRPSSSSLKILREGTMNANPVVDNVPNLIELSKSGDSLPFIVLNNLGNLERLYIFSLGYTLQKVKGATLLTDGSMTKLKRYNSYGNIIDNYSFLASPDLNKVYIEGWGNSFPISSTFTNQILQYAIDGEETNGYISGRLASDGNTQNLINTLIERGWNISIG